MNAADNDNNRTLGTRLPSEAVVSETGLSSAMHDMRLLAKSYQEHQVSHEDAFAKTHQQSCAVDPRVLLIPIASPRVERWKIAMLATMILVGLSTSAIAVRMIMQSTPSAATHDYKRVEATTKLDDVHSLEPRVEEPELLVVPSESESTVYEVQSSPPSSRVNPQVHETSLPEINPPTKAKSAIPKSPSSKSASSTKADAGCDEIAFLVGVGEPCGDQAETSRSALDTEEEIAERPYRLSRAQVMGPMQSIEGRVRTCADRNDFEGIALVKIVIRPAGSVDKTMLDSGSEGFQTCVSAQVESLQFPKLSQPFTVSYPYTLR